MDGTAIVTIAAIGLDNANERLLIYRLDLGKQALLPAGAFSLPTLFQNAASGGTGNRGARQRQQR